MGKIHDRYIKQQLVPFFEPNQTPGKNQRPISIGTHELAAVLCYESLFPHTLRQLVNQGAHAIGVMSFNTWLGNTNWARLHAASIVLRSVENRRSGVFVNNNGPSMMVDSYGRVITTLPLGKQGFMSTELPVVSAATIYTRLGLIPLLVFLVISGIISGGFWLICEKKLCRYVVKM